jgi:hypothetical protein
MNIAAWSNSTKHWAEAGNSSGIFLQIVLTRACHGSYHRLFSGCSMIWNYLAMNLPEMRVEVSPQSATSMQDDSKGRWRAEPSQREILMLWLATCVIFVAAVAALKNYFAFVNDFGDSSAYMSVASAIRHWNFHGLTIKQFWGLPYAMAFFSRLTGMTDRAALLLICFASSLASVVIAYRLWGGWIAGFFAILNFDWMQRSYLGGSEPLFVALLFASFFAVRKERWWLAALLAACATTVRPLGFFALVGIGLVLLWRRDFRNLLPAIAIGLMIGILYVLPLKTQVGDPLATVHSYVNPQWQGGWLFGFPFYAIIKGTVTEGAPWTNLVLSFGWIFLVLIAIVVMIGSQKFREYARAHPVEMIFLIPYLSSLYTYNYPHWARGNFARFAIPIIPFVLLALYRWIPKDRRLLWGLCVVTSAFAAASALGVVNVVGLIRRAIG